MTENLQIYKSFAERLEIAFIKFKNGGLSNIVSWVVLAYLFSVCLFVVSLLGQTTAKINQLHQNLTISTLFCTIFVYDHHRYVKY